jgi:hypothetical protein
VFYVAIVPTELSGAIEMKIMKSLSLGVYQSAVANPTLERRAKLIAGLQEQKLLTADPSHLRKEFKWVVNDQGVKQRLEVQKRVRPWWRVDEVGRVMLSLRYGAKAVEIEKGKTAVLMSSADDLQKVIDTVMEAVRIGELDDVLARHSSTRRAKKLQASDGNQR